MKLKTLKGSIIQRSKYGVGKQMGQHIYVHKLYMDQVIPQEFLLDALELCDIFEFNTVMWNNSKQTIRFDSAKDFDTAREPKAGEYITVNYKSHAIREGVTNYIWHHKWLWVGDDYEGFDVKESFEWSKKWLSKINERAKGHPELWKNQLKKAKLN